MGAGMKYVFAEAKALPREGGTQLLCLQACHSVPAQAAHAPSMHVQDAQAVPNVRRLLMSWVTS